MPQIGVYFVRTETPVTFLTAFHMYMNTRVGILKKAKHPDTPSRASSRWHPQNPRDTKLYEAVADVSKSHRAKCCNLVAKK